MQTNTVLICDDSYAVHESLSIFLKQSNIQTVSVYNGADALRVLESRMIDLVVLDVMLPDISGTEVCRQIRQKSNIPILFLSAKTEEIDRILGLEIGGDDYVTKPFSPREVSIRIRKMLSRSSAKPKNTILTYAELSVNTSALEVRVNQVKIDMTVREVNLLAYMVSNAEKVLNREQLLQAVWGYDYFGDTRAVDAAIKRIRQKLPTEQVHFAIQSVYGVGYRLGEI